MSQQVIVTANTSLALKPLLESAIRSELRMLELGLERTTKRLHAFEQQYNLSSEAFERQFTSGQMNETLDFIEWAGEIKTRHLLLAQQQALREAHLD